MVLTDRTEQSKPTVSTVERDRIDRRRDAMMAAAWPVSTDRTEQSTPTGRPQPQQGRRQQSQPTDQSPPLFPASWWRWRRPAYAGESTATGRTIAGASPAVAERQLARFRSAAMVRHAWFVGMLADAERCIVDGDDRAAYDIFLEVAYGDGPLNPADGSDDDRVGMMDDEITVEVCGSCAVVVFNGDSTHLDDSENLATIEATIETMHEPALGDYTSGGYVRCYVCGDDVIGSHRVTCKVAP